MHHPQPVPADAFAADENRHGEAVSARRPEWLVHLLVRIILFMLRTRLVRQCYQSRLPEWMTARPDLPPASALALAAWIRGEFGNAVAWMCMRRGIGPGHREWPYLSHAIVAFGGSLERVDGRLYPMQWWDSHWIAPAVVSPEPAAPSATALLLERESIARDPLWAWRDAPAGAGQAASCASRVSAGPALPAAWLLAASGQPSASGRLSWLRPFARDGTGPPTGPPHRAALPASSHLTPSRPTHGASPWPAPPY